MSEKRLEVNDTMPNYTFSTGYRDNLTIQEVVKATKKTVFWVLRYIGCSLCRVDVEMIKNDYSKFVDKDTQVIVVMQSDKEHIQRELTEDYLPFEIICDDKMEIYKDLLILPAASQEEMGADGAMEKLSDKFAKIKEYGFVHGDYEGDEMQLPALFITDDTGKILYAHYAKNIADMPSVDEVIALL